MLKRDSEETKDITRNLTTRETASMSKLLQNNVDNISIDTNMTETNRTPQKKKNCEDRFLPFSLSFSNFFLKLLSMSKSAPEEIHGMEVNEVNCSEMFKFLKKYNLEGMHDNFVEEGFENLEQVCTVYIFTFGTCRVYVLD